MPNLNVEIKAYCTHPARVREYLVSRNAIFKGIDFQTDTYFQVPGVRLKLREGNIENNLIYYQRPDQAGPKNSSFYLTPVQDPSSLKIILTAALGIKVMVSKRREIYYIDNVKFHIDEVNGLGSFVEIEAGNLLADLSQSELRQQCEFYMNEFGIKEEELVKVSYSDLLLEENNHEPKLQDPGNSTIVNQKSTLV